MRAGGSVTVGVAGAPGGPAVPPFAPAMGTLPPIPGGACCGKPPGVYDGVGLGVPMSATAVEVPVGCGNAVRLTTGGGGTTSSNACSYGDGYCTDTMQCDDGQVVGAIFLTRVP